jgi:hypothetical protein
MKLFRHLGLTIAIFWCAAMVLIPLAAAADAGYGTNQGMNQGTNQPPGLLGMNPGQANQGNNQGNNQMQQGPGQVTGSGNTMTYQGNNQYNAESERGNRTQWIGRENVTEFGNRTEFVPEGNMTQPEKPVWDTSNMTVMNRTIMHGHGAGNMTDIPPPTGGDDPKNTTSMNSTAWHDSGNMTLRAPPAQRNTSAQGQQQVQNQQETQELVDSTGDLIAQFLEWLKACGIT